MMPEIHKKTVIKQRPSHSIQGGEHLPLLLRRLYGARGIHHAEEADFRLESMLPYTQLPGIDQAVDLLLQALRERHRLLIVGDYDADGATATAVLLRALKQFGFKHLSYAVPNRFQYGYGLSPKLVEEMHQSHRPDLIVTVDNGVSSVAGVAAANALGMRVLVSDHHLAGDTLPAAAAIVNPNLPGSDFPSRALAGVGVAFYLMLALRGRLKRETWFDERQLPDLKELLDLVALGTVADLVPMDKNNRIMVDYGLRRMRAGRSHAGINALFAAAGKTPSMASSADLGFSIAPRINAAGRLKDIGKGIACLISDNKKEAEVLAGELHALNKARQTIESETLATVWENVDKLLSRRQLTQRQGLCLFSPDWHEGIIGLIAARVRERLNAPVFIFTSAQDGQLRGSGRSIRNVHLRDLIVGIDRQKPGLIAAFGGHSQAAGMTLAKDNYPLFARLFAQAAADCMDGREDAVELFSDGELQAHDFSYQTACLLRTAAPWGTGFPEPLFDGSFVVVGSHTVAQKHRQLRLMPYADDELCLRAMLFNAERHGMLDKKLERVHILYSLEVDTFRRRQSVSLTIKHIQAD